MEFWKQNFGNGNLKNKFGIMGILENIFEDSI